MTHTDSLIHEDVRLLRDILPTAAPRVDVTITSPPYWNLKDYEAENQIGHGQTREEYLTDMRNVLEDCLLVTKSTGSLWLVADTYREDGELQLLPFELAEIAREVGWKPRDLIIWDKQHSLPWHARGQLRDVSEYIFFLTKTDNYKYYVDRIKTLDEISEWWVDFPERYNPKGKTPTNIWSIPLRTRGTWREPSKLNHYCSFPTALAARIIELTTDPRDLVMDPFAGSGVVLAQASVMGRHYLGFEVNQEYIQMFEEVVKEEVASDWAEMKAWRETQTDARLDFEQTVMKLRALKYTRQVTRPFREDLKPEQEALIRAIFCIASIPDEYQRGRPFDVQVMVVVGDNIPEFEAALEATKNRSTRPPLTQYGIQSDIEVNTYSDFVREADLAGEVLYLYPEYKPRKYAASGPLESWFEQGRLERLSKPGKVPMLANIAVDVEWVLETG